MPYYGSLFLNVVKLPKAQCILNVRSLTRQAPGEGYHARLSGSRSSLPVGAIPKRFPPQTLTWSLYWHD